MVQHADIDHTGITGTGAVGTDPIWDAAGDVAVGSGANTAARLPIGNAGGHLSRINGAVAWDSGTSNPGSAAAGDRYWRTDIQGGLGIFYDGTRWLSQQMFPLHVPSTVSGSGQSATYGMQLGGFFGTYDMYVERLCVSTLTSTTQSGTQYWTFQLEKNDVNTYSSVGSALSTQSLAADDWVLLTTDIDTVVSLATCAEMRVLATKVSTAGNNFANATVYYRLIIT